MVQGLGQTLPLDLGYATTNIRNFFLSILQYAGMLGDDIFIISSCWFLLDSKRLNLKKIFFMLVEIWTISVLFLLCVELFTNQDVGMGLILKSFFPTTFSNNWYMTAYILFYLVHTQLNKIINSVSQKALLRSCLLLGLLCLINFLISDLFFYDGAFTWVAMYFCMAYIKRYGIRIQTKKKMQLSIFVFGLVAYFLQFFVTNFLGLRIAFFQDKIYYWLNIRNPFIFMIALGLFLLVKDLDFHNKTINWISGLSLLIYLIHNNILIRTYFRSIWIQKAYEYFGESFMIAWILLLSVVIFLLSGLIAAVYRLLLQKYLRRISDGLYEICKKIYGKAEAKFLS